jgi:predicted nucleotidyltransferase
LANINLRDRDAIVSKEGLIFRVFGYDHPKNVYICDVEYASAKIFSSRDPRAPRTGANQLFYKFYNDEGLNLILKKYPQYTFYHEVLQSTLIGVQTSDLFEIRKPQQKLKKILEKKAPDDLIDATQRVLKKVKDASNLNLDDFGVFGSMLHDFYHPKYSDIDLVIYGTEANRKVRNTLKELYLDDSSNYSNEFNHQDVMKGKLWRFKDFTLEEYVWHQKRKLIYGIFNDTKSGRIIKAEFEPVKSWEEIIPYYNKNDRVISKGWTRIKARVINDTQGAFIPSIYEIEPLSVINGPKSALETTRVFSYMEEFRQQVKKDEIIIVEGNLEKISSNKRSFYQIVLTYCPRYYEQVLKVKDPKL